MPSYHCSVKSGGKGRAGKHSDYISREGKYAPELTKGSGSKLEDLEHTASGNMPEWSAHDPGIFWRAADEHERANGATYREIEVALPRELNPAQRRELVEDFIQQHIGDRHPYTYAIHKPKAAIEKGEQPHAHIMYSERTLDGIARDPDLFFKRANTKAPEKGGCKKASGGKSQSERKAELLGIRERWADVQNRHLERAGIAERVTHLSLKEQGIERTPEIHLGPVLAREHAPALREHRAAERELAQTPQVDATAELAAQAQAQAAREAAQAQAAQQAREAAEAQQQADREARRQAAEAEAQQARAAAEAKKKAINTKLTVAPLVDSPFDKAGLHRSDDLELVRRAQELFSQPQPDGYARYTLQRDISSAMSAAVREISDTDPRHATSGAERTIKDDQNAAARRAGQPEPWRAEQTACAWDTIAFRLDRERTEHLDTKRPSGFFSGSAAKEYDAKTASLTSQLDNVRRATETLKAELQAKLAAAQAQQAAQRDPQRHAAAKERHEGLMLLHKAVGDAGREIDAERAHGHDRENDNDFGL